MFSIWSVGDWLKTFATLNEHTSSKLIQPLAKRSNNLCHTGTTSNQHSNSTHSHQQSAHSFPGLNLNPFCLLLQATQPPTIPTPNTSKNLNLRMHNHSPSRNQPTTTSSKLKQPTNFHHAPLQQPATAQQAPVTTAEQSSSKLIQHRIQRTNQLEASTTTLKA